ncbi:carboxymuconolactone decarboxylase family protein [Streptomyces olivaceoviridis]
MWTAIQHLQKAIAAGGVDPKFLAPVHLRAGQINGCSACVYASVVGGKRAGDTDERLHNAAAWREAPSYTDTERAALALAEAATRLQDGAQGLTDEMQPPLAVARANPHRLRPGRRHSPDPGPLNAASRWYGGDHRDGKTSVLSTVRPRVEMAGRVRKRSSGAAPARAHLVLRNNPQQNH